VLLISELIELRARVERLESLLGIVEQRTVRYRAGKRLWTPEDDALLCERYPHEATKSLAAELRRSVPSVYKRAGNLGLEKTAEYLAAAAGRTLRVVGEPHRFRKGHVPANKGLRRPGWAPGRMSETQFERGCTPLNWMPLGSTRLVDGYVYRKIGDTRRVPWTRKIQLLGVLRRQLSRKEKRA